MRPFSYAFLLAVGLLGSVSPAAYAASCEYDVTPLPVISGDVSRVTESGVLLRDGRELIVPESLLSFVRLEKILTVRGLKSLDGRKIWVFALEGTTRVCPSKNDVRKGAYPGSPSYDVIGHDEQEKQ